MYPKKADRPRLHVINLWGGPGSGKSTSAAGLFNLMKNLGYSVELVTEYAKDMVYAGRLEELHHNQLYVFAKQDARLRRNFGKSKIVITDSPLPLSLIYRDKDGPFWDDWFTDAVLATWRHYENHNVLINRTKKFSPQGRTQKTAEEAKALDAPISNYLNALSPRDFLGVDGDQSAPRNILGWLQKERGLYP